MQLVGAASESRWPCVGFEYATGSQVLMRREHLIDRGLQWRSVNAVLIGCGCRGKWTVREHECLVCVEQAVSVNREHESKRELAGRIERAVRVIERDNSSYKYI